MKNIIIILVIAVASYIVFINRETDVVKSVSPVNSESSTIPIKASLVIHNTTIYTANDQQRTAEAVAVKDDRIIFVGSNDEVRSYIGKNTSFLDMIGNTVYPGFNDAHVHLKWIGERELGLNLQGLDDLKSVVNKIKAYADNIEDGNWVTGRGWIEKKWPENRFLHKSDVDWFSANKPLLVSRAGEHSILANTKAMQIAGINRDTPDPQGGQILHDKDGEPSGIFIDNAMALIRKHIPPPTREMDKKSLQAGLDFMSRMGWTQVQEAGGSFADIEILKEIHEQGNLKSRIYYSVISGQEGARLIDKGIEISPDNMIIVRGIKYLADGALGSRGAALLDPYDDADTKGLLLINRETTLPVFIDALKNGVQIETHAIGDYANRFVLDLYAEAFNAVPISERKIADPRWRIEHAQITHPDEQQRFSDLGVIAVVEASTVKGDLYFAPARIGSERLKYAYRWKSLIDKGVMLTAGTDAPVEVGDPRVEFFSLVQRTDFNGFSSEDWHVEEKVSHDQALKIMTINAAYAAFQEDMRGSIEVGKKADFSIFDKDFMTIKPIEIMDSKTVMTIVDGKVTYKR